MNVIFEEKDFCLCEVPSPEGYPQSQTHSGIASSQGVYYLTTSPFPSFRGNFFVVHFKSLMNKLSRGAFFNIQRAEAYENPCLYIGDAKSTPPLVFKPMQRKPLMDTPEDYYDLPAFNSDPDIFIDNDKMFIVNRVVYRTELRPGEPLNKYDIQLFLISGENDKGKFKLDTILRLTSSKSRLLTSPCFLKHKNFFYLFELETNSYNDGESFNGLYFISSNRINGLRENNEWKKIEVDAGGLLPWHMSVFENKGRLFAVVACVKKGEKQRCWQMLGEFDVDITTLKIFQTPLTAFKSYRGSALVTEEGEFVLYSTTVNERIKGSKSVDGRDIIMAHMPFSEMMDKLRKGES